VCSLRKLHLFINPATKPGSRYVVFELHGWKCGIFICYDDNVVENVRTTALLGAEIIFRLHGTMCTPYPDRARAWLILRFGPRVTETRPTCMWSSTA
jgi:predicted amidohydrolase